MSFQLITSYDGIHRWHEVLTCLEKNAANPFIDRIVLIHELHNDARDPVNEFAFENEKITTLMACSGRPDYRNLFRLSNELGLEKPIIANSDIYFDETLGLLDGKDLSGCMIVLTRRELEGNHDGYVKQESGPPVRYNFEYFENRIGASDAWIFQGPIPDREDFGGNLVFGTQFCDQILHAQAFNLNMRVFNPCLDVHAWHVHKQRDLRYLEHKRETEPNGARAREQFGVQLPCEIPFCYARSLP